MWAGGLAGGWVRRRAPATNTWTIGNMTQKLKEVSLKQLTPVRTPSLWVPTQFALPPNNADPVPLCLGFLTVLFFVVVTGPTK